MDAKREQFFRVARKIETAKRLRGEPFAMRHFERLARFVAGKPVFARHLDCRGSETCNANVETVIGPVRTL